MTQPIIMPAITLWQPWACLIEVGAKIYETRTKPPPKRLIGQRVAIHAAKRPVSIKGQSSEFLDACDDAFGGCHWPRTLPLGVIVCTAEIVGAMPAQSVPRDLFGDYTMGRWAWLLKDVRPVEPHIPAKGMQTWGWPWSVPASVTL